MNMVLAKHVDFTVPFEGLIKVKEVIFCVTVPSQVNLRRQRHRLQIKDSHEVGVFLDGFSSKDQDSRGRQLVEAGPYGENKGLFFGTFDLQ